MFRAEARKPLDHLNAFVIARFKEASENGNRVFVLPAPSRWSRHVCVGASRAQGLTFESERRGLAASRGVSFLVFLRRAAVVRRAGLPRAGSAPCPAPLLSAASINALYLATPIAARPRLVMRSASAPLSSSRRQNGRAPRAEISWINPSRSSLPATLWEAPPLRLGANSENLHQPTRKRECNTQGISYFSCRGPQHFQRSAPSHLNKNTARLQSMPLSRNVTAPP